MYTLYGGSYNVCLRIDSVNNLPAVVALVTVQKNVVYKLIP